MKKKNIQIEIPQPCHEKWNDMTPVEKGNFCMSCQKVVVDFTNQSDRAIGQFFKQSKGEVCGRFRPHQLNRPIPLTQTVSPSYTKVSAALFSGLMLTASATAQTNPTVEVTAPRPVVETHITGLVGETKSEINKLTPQQIIKGVVVDEDNGEPILFGNVSLFNTKKEFITGCETDFDGKFELIIPDGYLDKINELYLEASYIGYTSTKIEYTLFSENMEVRLSNAIIMGELVTIGLIVPYYQYDRTLWQSGRRLWDRLKYDNPIKNWIENRRARKAAKAKEKAIQQEQNTIPVETNHHYEKLGKVYIQNPEDAAFNIVRVSPNPFQTDITLNIEMIDAGQLMIYLFTENGQQVFNHSEKLEKGIQSIQLDVSASSLVAGTYILNVFHENGFQKSEVLMLQ